MKKIVYSLIFLLFNQITLAYAEDVYSCPLDDGNLSQLFAGRWEFVPERTSFFSYVEIPINNNNFKGTLHANQNNFSQDLNPHLSFASLDLKQIPHYGVWKMDCKYRIGNSTIKDMDDGYLHLSLDIPLAKKCVKYNINTTHCSSN